MVDLKLRSMFSPCRAFGHRSKGHELGGRVVFLDTIAYGAFCLS